MHCDRSKVIVGFKSYLCNLDSLGSFASAEDMAWHELTTKGPKLPGLIRVIRRLKHLNTVVLQIDSAEFEAFRILVLHYDSVEYCDINYALKPADFTDSVAASFRRGTPCGRVVRTNHVSGQPDPGTLGVGTRVALIDSGISPHPFLPSLSSSELALKLTTMHWSIPSGEREALCKAIATAERTASGAVVGSAIRPVPFGSGGPPLGPTDFPDLYAPAIRAAERYAEDQWTGWEQGMSAWLAKQRKTPRPPYPCYPMLFGQMRLISPLSRSFLEDELSFGVNDVVGHGTQMAGLVAALHPMMDCSNSNADIRSDFAHPLGLDLVGVAPYAELLVLKCCHDIDEANNVALDGWMLNALDAITYVIDNGADVVYFGFAIHGCDPKTVSAASALLAKLEQGGCAIVAPVGNETKWGALAFPASSPHVRAIGSVTNDAAAPSGLSKAHYSATADRRYREKVSFSAFGGDPANAILTPSIDFGINSVWGTSASSALAAGIYSSEIGAEGLRQISREYESYVGQSGQIDVPNVRSLLAAWRPPRRPLATIDSALASRVSKCHELNDPDAGSKVGRGVLRV